MVFKHDPDLVFFAYLESNDFNDLVDCLIHDNNKITGLLGKKRWMEELTKNPIYIKHNPDHIKYWHLIAGELQCFGGHTLLRPFRSGGVLYREILCDVCSKMKVNFNKKSSTERIEENFMMKIVEDALDKMSPEEIEQLLIECGQYCVQYGVTFDDVKRHGKEALLAVFQAIFRAGGFKSYQVTLIIVNALWRALFGKGLTLGANATITKILSILTGPIGWAITGLWTAIDLGGPAYRVTIPAVAQVSLMRQKYLASTQSSEQAASNDTNSDCLEDGRSDVEDQDGKGKYTVRLDY